jgi:hypothetical protein
VASLHGLIRKNYGKLYAERLVLDVDRDATPAYAPLGFFPTGEPTNAAEGAVYFDDTLGALKSYTGSAWEPVGGSRIEVLTASTRALNTYDNGKTFIFNLATGIDVALPAVGASDVGLNYTFLVGLAATSETYTVTAQAGDLLIGRVLIQDTDTANTIVSHAADASDDLIFTISDTADLPGGWVQFICMSATAWLVRGTLFHTGNSATPFS